jgi:hypothetical protein
MLTWAVKFTQLYLNMQETDTAGFHFLIVVRVTDLPSVAQCLYHKVKEVEVAASECRSPSLSAVEFLNPYREGVDA